MKTEKLVSRQSDKSINIVANCVESLRINNSVKNTVRVYDNGMIGVEGSLGEANWAELEQKATEKLAQGIAYPETHQKPCSVSVDSVSNILEEKDFIPKVQHLLERLASENPDFLFSDKVQLNSTFNSYQSSDGVRYSYKGNQFIVNLSIKHKGSANIMDEGFACESDYFDEDSICHDVKLVCDAFLNELPHIEEEEVTVIGGFEPLFYALQHFASDLYFNNASLFNGKLGQKIFADNLSVEVNRDPAKQLNIAFFDAEGVVNVDYVNYIVKNGVLERLLTCKRSAEQYGTENIGCASASYNGVPNMGADSLDVTDTADSLADLVTGKAVYLSLSSGGDMTPSGDISLPSMVSYLYEDGKLVGKLPQFAVSVNLFDMLNDGFVGVTEKGPFQFGKHKYFVYKAKIVNKA